MIAIVDYNAGNLTSVKRALDSLGIECVITPDPDAIRSADRVIFPGVGHAASAMQILTERKLDTALRQVFESGTPLLGICLGTQIILSHSHEADTPCLGLLQGECPRLNLPDKELKIPHMGWNGLIVKKSHPLLKDVKPGDEFYFVHSYCPQPVSSEEVYATCDYGIEFPVAVGKDNLFATQFHPEKSGKAGLAILRNFSQWDGKPC